MNRDDIIRMVREAGLKSIYSACDEPNVRYAYEDWDDELERFAALVAAAKEKEVLDRLATVISIAVSKAMIAEREACAKVCDELFELEPSYTNYANAAEDCAAAIRARGQE